MKKTAQVLLIASAFTMVGFGQAEEQARSWSLPEPTPIDSSELRNETAVTIIEALNQPQATAILQASSPVADAIARGLLVPAPGACSIPIPNGPLFPPQDKCLGATVTVAPNTEYMGCIKKNPGDINFSLCFLYKTGGYDPLRPGQAWGTYTYLWHANFGFNLDINGTAYGSSQVVLSMGPQTVGTKLNIRVRHVDSAIWYEDASKLNFWAQKR